MAHTMSAYELARAANVQRNNELLRAMGIMLHVPQKRVALKRRRHMGGSNMSVPTRRSPRVVPALEYDEDAIFRKLMRDRSTAGSPRPDVRRERHKTETASAKCSVERPAHRSALALWDPESPMDSDRRPPVHHGWRLHLSGWASSGYMGVSQTRCGFYKAEIRIGGKRGHTAYIGTYTTILDAAVAYAKDVRSRGIPAPVLPSTASTSTRCTQGELGNHPQMTGGRLEREQGAQKAMDDRHQWLPDSYRFILTEQKVLEGDDLVPSVVQAEALTAVDVEMQADVAEAQVEAYSQEYSVSDDDDVLLISV